MTATQHDNNMVATQHDNNMVATQHGTNIIIIIGHRNQHKGQEGRDNNTSREAATTVSKSVHDWGFEWRDGDKTVQFVAGRSSR